MNINVSQVGQDFASPIVDIASDTTRTKGSKEEDLAAVRQQTKDLSVSAEKESVSAEQIETAVS
jgi:hypothetical protein